MTHFEEDFLITSLINVVSLTMVQGAKSDVGSSDSFHCV